MPPYGIEDNLDAFRCSVWPLNDRSQLWRPFLVLHSGMPTVPVMHTQFDTLSPYRQLSTVQLTFSLVCNVGWSLTMRESPPKPGYYSQPSRCKSPSKEQQQCPVCIARLEGWSTSSQPAEAMCTYCDPNPFSSHVSLTCLSWRLLPEMKKRFTQSFITVQDSLLCLYNHLW